MNRDLRLAVGYFQNIKIKKLCRMLGEHGLIMHLRLLAYVAEHRPNGEFDCREDVEAAVDWDGKAGVFVAALLKLKLLDKRPGRAVAVHDWKEHNEWASDDQDRSERARANAHKKYCAGPGMCAKDYCPNRSQTAPPSGSEGSASGKPAAEPESATGSASSEPDACSLSLSYPAPVPPRNEEEENPKENAGAGVSSFSSGEKNPPAERADVCRVLDAFPADYPFPLPAPSQVERWVATAGVTPVIEAVEKYAPRKKNPGYIETCIVSATAEDSGRKRSPRKPPAGGKEHDNARPDFANEFEAAIATRRG